VSAEERLKRALERAGALSFSGTGYRFVALRYADPERALSGEGAARYGGRYNPVGVRTVYLSEDARTAVAETGYGVSLGGRFSAKDREARLLLAVEFRLQQVLDLRDPAVLATLGLDVRDLVAPGWREALRRGQRPLTHALALAALDLGFEAILAPSAAVPGAYNLAVYVGHLLPGSVLRLAGTDEQAQ